MPKPVWVKRKAHARGGVIRQRVKLSKYGRALLHILVVRRRGKRGGRTIAYVWGRRKSRAKNR